MRYYLLHFICLCAFPQPSLANQITYSTTDEFILDTPIPTAFERVSLDFHTSHSQNKHGSTTHIPALMANVGVYPDVQFFANVPATLAAPKHLSTRYGYGDVRLGIKYRFLHETETLPNIAFYPKITLPSGDARKGIGNGRWIGRFPLWMQKRCGAWKFTTGGGYYINQATHQHNYPFGGFLIQWQVSQYFMLGNEFVGEGKINTVDRAKLIYNFGGSYFFNPNSFLAFSIGHTLAGPNRFIAFLGYGIAWGPPPAP